MPRWTRLLCFFFSGFAVLAAAEPRKPNLIYILADDLGYGELGCYGQKVILTPQLDRMAQEGMKFSQFYAGAAVCAPSRSVLLTGQHQGRTRVRGNAGARNPQAQALKGDDLTFARLLQQSGYRTGLIGKWGLGDVGAAESGLPRRQGFDEFFGYLNQQHAHNHFPDFLWRNETKVPLRNDLVRVGPNGAGYATKPAQYADDLFAEECLRFVAENKDRPFFLFWSMVVPHANNERTRRLGDGAEVPDYGPYAGKDWPNPDKGQAAMISRMDDHVGRLLAQLRKLGLAENTLVVFTSDNGPHDESRHDLTRFAPAAPFSGIKRSLTDGGIRVPFLAWWPGRIKPGSACEHAAYAGDWFATVMELAGAKLPAGLDSTSLVPALEGRATAPAHDYFYWESHDGAFRQAVLFEGRWKAIRQGAADRLVRLYDLRTDPAESHDLAMKQPALARQLGDYLAKARTDSPDWVPGWAAKAVADKIEAEK